MIIWIDGTYGVGKTSTLKQIEVKLKNKKIKVFRSDYFYQKYNKDNPLDGGGATPQNNIKFIKYFRNIIEEQVKKADSDLIIDMSLTQKESKELLFEYFTKKGIEIKHFILTASIDTIKSRIKKDGIRDKGLAYSYLEQNINFLNINYSEAIRINTENKKIEEVAKEILQTCSLIE